MNAEHFSHFRRKTVDPRLEEHKPRFDPNVFKLIRIDNPRLVCPAPKTFHPRAQSYLSVPSYRSGNKAGKPLCPKCGREFIVSDRD